MINTITSLNKVHSTVLGQDRLIRTYTFLLRFIRVHLVKKLQEKDSILMWQKKIDSVCQQFVLTRKILRWSRTFHLTLSIALTSKRKTHSQWDIYKKINDLAFHTFQIAADISDFLLWICQIGLCKNINILKKTKEIEPKFYLIESSWWIFTLSFEHILIKENAIRKKQIKFNIIRYFLDMLVSMALVYQNISPEKTVIFGSVSSLMGVYQICV